MTSFLAGPGGVLGRSNCCRPWDAGGRNKCVSFSKACFLTSISDSCPSHAEGSPLARGFCHLVNEHSLKLLVAHFLSYESRGWDCKDRVMLACHGEYIFLWSPTALTSESLTLSTPVASSHSLSISPGYLGCFKNQLEANPHGSTLYKIIAINFAFQSVEVA